MFISDLVDMLVEVFLNFGENEARSFLPLPVFMLS